MSELIVRENELSQLKNLAKIAYESKQYAGQSETSLLNLMLSARDLGIPALKALNGGFYIVSGKPTMSTALMSDMIRRAGHSLKIVEMTTKQCVIIGQRKDNGDSFKFEYTMEDATNAGLINSPTWKKFPKHMLYNRCMSTVARVLFSDVIGNAYSEDEKYDIKEISAEERPLEDPNFITLEQPSEFITEEQESTLKSLIQQCKEETVEEDLKKFFGIMSLSNLKTDQYEKCIKSLNKKISMNSKETGS